MSILISFYESLSAISICNLPAPPLLCFFLVLHMPDFGFFILPFGVAGDGTRHLRMLYALLIKGMSAICLLCVASMSILIGALKIIDACTLVDFFCMGVCTRMH